MIFGVEMRDELATASTVGGGERCVRSLFVPVGSGAAWKAVVRGEDFLGEECTGRRGELRADVVGETQIRILPHLLRTEQQ